MPSPRALLTSAFLLAAFPACADSVSGISSPLCADMTAHRVMSANARVGCERLALVRFSYAGFDGRDHDDGELVVLDVLADRVLTIFRELRARRFPLGQARLMNAYDGDDDASMDANNTSAYNDRNVIGMNSISMHAYGAAIDVNPVQNPYVERVNGAIRVAPKAAAEYLARKPLRPGMAESIVSVFAAHGFTVWGGRWRNPDYQHFQIERALAEKLVRLPADRARAMLSASRNGQPK
jgi:D-alanyl-D-alanine carboxypeptidase